MIFFPYSKQALESCYQAGMSKLPTSSLRYTDPQNDLKVHKIYSQADILDFSSP